MMSTIDSGITIGSDEAGKGEWLGPMTVSAVALTPRQSVYLRQKGVVDSKLLRLDRISELAPTIVENCVASYTVVITPRRFNELLKEIRDEGKTLNDLLAWGHATAIARVLDNPSLASRQSPVRVLIDEFDRIKTERRLSRLLATKNIIVEQRPTAEEETPVAAASILARSAREEWIDRESKRLNTDLRSLSAVKVLSLTEAESVAKLSYLRPK